MPPYSEMSFELLQKQSPNMPSPLSLAGVEVLFHAFVSSHMDQYAPFVGLPVPARIINRLQLVHHAPTILHQAPEGKHALNQPGSRRHCPRDAKTGPRTQTEIHSHFLLLLLMLYQSTTSLSATQIKLFNIFIFGQY